MIVLMLRSRMLQGRCETDKKALYDLPVKEGIFMPTFGIFVLASCIEKCYNIR